MEITKIQVDVIVSQEREYFDFDFEDLNVSSYEEWQSLSEDERKERLQEAIDNVPSQPFWLVDKYSEY